MRSWTLNIIIDHNYLYREYIKLYRLIQYKNVGTSCGQIVKIVIEIIPVFVLILYKRVLVAMFKLTRSFSSYIHGVFYQNMQTLSGGCSSVLILIKNMLIIFETL